ncbi:acetyl-CoA synthetase-like protein [Durotheca rogersii]|uniref:acetyl-CoA synthetase-like protein n=1 Tax=Durotheca rogersii TaxID=419775 RepID=UPI002220FADA|nr:acetyl-CoA synthetase-like protein [Durotheca rogersii]KAI5857326.1 acetyl-CoA synthetase-like protein [Durotheca rogersii]
MDRYREDAGQRLFPHIIDELGELEPGRILYEIPTQDDIDAPFVKVTAQAYADAISRASWWLDETLGRGADFPTLGYAGPQDIRYLILVAAAIKTGYKMLFTSPRNSTEGDIAVIRAASCSIWLVPSEGSNIERVLGQLPLKTVSLPDLDYFFTTERSAKYGYRKTWEQGRRDPAWVLHTSGSTGHPKPVVRFLDSVASIGANNLLPKVDGRPLLLHDYYGSRVYLTFPFYHAAGLANAMMWPLFHGTAVVLGPDKPVNLDLMKSVIERAKPDAVFTAPYLVEEISRDEEFLVLIGTVKALAYGGGPVSLEAGNRIWKHTKLRLSIGTTETGWLPCIETDPEDWNYIRLHPNAGLELQDRGGGLYELVAIRKAELARWQPVFSTFPELQEYYFRDLFSRHPTKQDLYRYEGRADNILVLLNGEKVQPSNMELIIGSYPLVKAVVIAGHGRFQTSAVIEVVERAYVRDEVGTRRLIDELWPSIEAANRSAPTHAKLYRDFVIIASPDKPFPKTSKGTVRRGLAIELYEKELELVYSRDKGSPTLDDLPVLDFGCPDRLRTGIKKVIQAETQLEELGDDDDFFAVAGLNSLQVLSLSRAFSASLSREKQTQSTSISASIIYRNPTINMLADAFISQTQTSEDSAEKLLGRPNPLSRLISKYVDALPGSTSNRLGAVINIRRDRLFVILTGSTGSLGSYLLDALMKCDTVDEIWCLNRSPDAPARQLSRSRSQGLETDFQSYNVHFRHAILSDQLLGLSAADYAYLAQNATHIIHTQWKVDFNLTLSSFEPHIKGVRNLIALAVEGSTAEKTTSIFFTSSIGVANNPSSPGVPVAEKPLRDGSAAVSGYGESKLVAEQLLLAAHEKDGLSVTICRVGQIAGPVRAEHRRGLWKRSEWFPSIVDASALLGLVPESLGRNDQVDWIPVDLLSSIILQLARVEPEDGAEHATGPQVFHAVNPQKTGWGQSLLPTVVSRLGTRSKTGSVEIVPLEKWIEGLQSVVASPDSQGSDILSASKLIPFLAGLSRSSAGPEFETSEATRLSGRLRGLERVGSEWLDIWLDQWGY